MADHELYLGDDGETEYLLTVFDDSTHTITTRPVNSGATWSAPVELRPVPAEVCS